MDGAAFGDADYRELLNRRSALRRFLKWSEREAQSAGLTDTQHQLLIAIRGHTGSPGPSLTDVARYLALRHNSVVELVQRAVLAGLVTRHEDRDDHRRVRLGLSDAGAAALEQLASVHRAELHLLTGDPIGFSAGIGGEPETTTLIGAPAGIGIPVTGLPADRPSVTAPPVTGAHVAATAVEPAGAAEMVRETVVGEVGAVGKVGDIAVRSMLEAPGTTLGRRVLIDRTWPRGVRAGEAPFDDWMSTIAPSGELRRWFDQDPARFTEFSRRYLAELRQQHGQDLDRLVELASTQPLTLLTGAHDVESSAASVLAGEIGRRRAELASDRLSL